MLTINELLFSRGLPKNAKIKLIRHVDVQRDLWKIYKFEREAFLEYQSEQWKPIFHNTEYIISFLGEGGTKSRFIGVFQVNDFHIWENGNYFYSLIEIPNFEDIKNRVIIDWISLPRSWHQWMNPNKPKPILEILPQNTLQRKAFSDYLDFILDFSELKNIIENPDIFKDWHMMLSAVKWIYLILDTKTGDKYIGSAYNEENWILGRWREYIKTNGHGNNKKLKELILQNENYAKNFQFTLLMTLPMTMTKNEVIKREQLYKLKLWTRTFWLNEN